MNNKKIIGILGGMGPYATLAFYKKLLDCVNSEKDSDFPHVIIDSNPHIPSRTRAFLYSEESPKKEMILSARRLIDGGATILTLPCNSAHYFLLEIEKELNIKFINMVEETSKCIVQLGYKRVGVLGGEVTVQAKLYEKYLSENEVEVVQVDAKQQQLVRDIIEDVKQNKISQDTKTKFTNLLDLLYLKNCETVILGCTELGTISEGMPHVTRVIDSVECLAKASLEQLDS